MAMFEKIRISEKGLLSIWRKGIDRWTTCPWSPNERKCGDWCPHFGEPELAAGLSGESYLPLGCGKGAMLVAKKIIDER